MDRNQCEGLTTTLTAGPGGRTAAIPALLLTFAGPLEAAGGNYSGGADLEPSVAPIDEGGDVAAIDRLHVELDCDPRSVDIRPVLGFSNRKTRRFDDAPTFCQWAPASSRSTAVPASISANSVARPAGPTRRCASSRSSTTGALLAARSIHS